MKLIGIFSILFLWAGSGVAAAAKLPVTTRLEQCGTGLALFESCTIDARCCAIIEPGNIKTPQAEDDHLYLPEESGAASPRPPLPLREALRHDLKRFGR